MIYHVISRVFFSAIEEDMTHEFKAHKEMTKLDVSQVKYWRNLEGEYETKVSRRRWPLSKTLCGMLNTGLKVFSKKLVKSKFKKRLSK